jgi:hypothetical protein
LAFDGEISSLHRLVLEAHCVMEPPKADFGFVSGLLPHDVIK